MKTEQQTVSANEAFARADELFNEADRIWKKLEFVTVGSEEWHHLRCLHQTLVDAHKRAVLDFQKIK